MLIKAKNFKGSGQVSVVDEDPKDILDYGAGKKIVGAGRIGGKLRLIFVDKLAQKELDEVVGWATSECRGTCKLSTSKYGGYILNG